MNFGSDNQAGVSPRILQTLVEAASGIQSAYGNDEWSQRAEQMLGEAFGTPVKVFFVTTGTAANCLALSTIAQPWNAVVCHNMAHIAVDENSAPALFTGGASLLPMATDNGKISADDLAAFVERTPHDAPHNMVISGLSISQVTENGLVYQPQEIAALAAQAHALGLRLHMDGARLANAIAALQCHPGDITWRAGVDVLSLGASKNGALMAEAVVFFDPALAQNFSLRIKRSGQLVSKSRTIGAQFCAWLEGGHWMELARHANAMAAKLSAALVATPRVRLSWPTQANEVFVLMPIALYEQLRAQGVRCSDWYATSVPAGTQLQAGEVVVRFVTSWSSSDEEIAALMDLVHSHQRKAA